jgi:hypothetical protein
MIPETTYVLQCPKCGSWGPRTVRTELYKVKYICKFCNKCTKVIRRGSIGISLNHHGPYEDQGVAGEIIKTLNGKRHQGAKK